MNEPRKTVVVTGASQGIGAGIVRRFAERGFNVVASARRMTASSEVVASDRVAIVDGDIGEESTADRIVETALSRFRSLDALVNNAGVFVGKAFTDYTSEDIRRIFATNAEGVLYMTQRAILQMLAQRSGGSIVTITAALASNPVRGVNASVSMFTKGGLETLTRHLAMEYAGGGIRVNAVAPGVVYTPLQQELRPRGGDGGRVADGTTFDRRRHHERGHVPHRRPGCDRRCSLRRRRCTSRSLVVEAGCSIRSQLEVEWTMADQLKQWKELAAQLRVDSIRCTTAAGSGHPTSSMSAADLMAVLLAKYLRFDWSQPHFPNNDRLIFSKGHACPVLYSMFKAAGAITDEELMSLRAFGSRLQGHPNPHVLPYVDVATGSLGQGLPIGVGMALNGKYVDKLPYRVYVVLGDSECAEGSIWEAFDKASYYKLGNLTAILDMNRLGQRGETDLGWNSAAYGARARAFGWNAVELV